jgi:hypothetical protein
MENHEDLLSAEEQAEPVALGAEGDAPLGVVAEPVKEVTLEAEPVKEVEAEKSPEVEPVKEATPPLDTKADIEISMSPDSASDPPTEVYSPKRALSSIVEDFSHFERFYSQFPSHASVVFSCVTSLRHALRDFREMVQQPELDLQ